MLYKLMKNIRIRDFLRFFVKICTSEAIKLTVPDTRTNYLIQTVVLFGNKHSLFCSVFLS